MIGSSGFSLEELKAINHIIEEIHYNVYSQGSLIDLMEGFMQNLKTQVYFDKGNFVFLTYDEPNSWYETTSFIPTGWDRDDIHRYIDNYVHIDDVIPILTRREEIVFRNEDIFSLKDRRKTQYYQEFVETSQIQTSIDANILLPDDFGVKLIIGFFRDPGKRGFSDKDVEIIRTYQPHLSSAISQCMKNDSLASLDHFFDLMKSFESLGLCIMDEQLNILSFNNTYRSFVHQTQGATVSDSELTRKMRQLCGTLATTQELNRIGPLEIYYANDSFFVEVVRHEQANSQSKYVGLFYSYSDFFLYRMTKLKSEYKLSNREFEILFLILKHGSTNEEVAKQLFISESTVKKHISSAYQKIGVKNQKQLLSLLKLM